MKKFLMVLLNCSWIVAQTPEVDVVRNLKNEIISENTKESSGLLRILEKYFNDGCKVTVNSEEIILKKNHFKQYAEIGAAFLPKIKKDYDLKIAKNISSGSQKKLNTVLKISEKQQIKIDFTLEKEKLSEINCKDIPLSPSKSLMLRGIFNLLK